MITSLYIVASTKWGRKEKNYPIRVKDVMACDKNKATLKSLLLLM